MALVDQLASVLGDLPVCERATERPASAADTIGRLEDLRHVPHLAQAIGARQPGEASPDDDDARRRGGSRGGCEAAERRDPDRSDAGPAQQRPPCEPRLVRGRRLGDGVPKHVCERCSHRLPFLVLAATMTDRFARCNRRSVEGYVLARKPVVRAVTARGLVGSPGTGSVAL